MSQKRASQSVLAIPGAGKRQPDFATAMLPADITYLFPDTAKTFYKFDQTREDQLDCSGQELYARILLGEIGDLSVSFDATPKIVGLLAAYAMGVAASPSGAPSVYTHAITELPFDSFQPPAFSAVFGFRGGATPLLLTGCVLNSFSLSGKARQKITGQASIKFKTATPLVFTFPACVNETALRFSDTNITADGVSQAAILRSWDFSYDNKLLTDDHAYTNAGTSPTRLERADRRERKINYSVLGDNSDAAYIAAQTGDQAPLILTLGATPNAVIFTAPNAQLELDGGGLAKDGQAGETNIKIAGMPMMNGAAMPLSASVINAQATAFLVSSV